MVLSNKKLKQKLRANLAESLTASMTQTKHSPKNSKPQSLKELIHSEILKPRLSTREKRRKTLPLPVSVRVNGSSDVSMVDTVGLEQQSDEEKKKKKRLNKRKADEVVENGSSISMESANLAKEMKTNTKGKTNKKKKRKNGKKVKKDEENKDSETRNGLHDLVEAVQINDDSVMNGKEVGDVATKVYVGGIPYYSSEDDIWSFFENCGTITEIDCMTFPESGKFRGIAIISFKKAERAPQRVPLASFSKPAPSKWDDAQKWIASPTSNRPKAEHAQGQGGSGAGPRKPGYLTYGRQPSVKVVVEVPDQRPVALEEPDTKQIDSNQIVCKDQGQNFVDWETDQCPVSDSYGKPVVVINNTVGESANKCWRISQ